jgi:hypothetical protein
LENADARRTNDAVKRAPAPIRKCRRSIIDALLRCTRIGEQDDLLLPSAL